MGAVIDAIKTVRDQLVLIATRNRETTNQMGIELTLDNASPRTRYALVGRYEDTDAHLAAKILTSEDCVVEAGSACGFMALYCLKKIGVAEYAMIEANPSMNPVIDKNFRLNEVEKPTLLNCAVGPERGTVTFNVSDTYISSSLLSHPKNTRPIEVEMKPLPDIVESLPFSPTALIMDIEGAEKDVPIEHFALFDKIVIETHARHVGDAAIDSLLAGLEGAGFVEVGREGNSLALVKQG